MRHFHDAQTQRKAYIDAWKGLSAIQIYIILYLASRQSLYYENTTNGIRILGNELVSKTNIEIHNIWWIVDIIMQKLHLYAYILLCITIEIHKAIYTTICLYRILSFYHYFNVSGHPCRVRVVAQIQTIYVYIYIYIYIYIDAHIW